MAEQENERLKQIDEELERIGPEKSKGKAISGVAVCGGIALICFIICFYLFSAFYISVSSIGMSSMAISSLITGIVLVFVFLTCSLFAVMNIIQLRSVVNHNRKVDALMKEKKTLQVQTVKEEESIETNEDTLLRLLSEGKITVEEYKKLSKK